MNSNKQQLRAQLKTLRANIPEDERIAIDVAITHNVLGLHTWQEANLVLPYLSFGAEVETRGIITAAWEQGKTVALPRCVEGTRDMKWYQVENFEGLVRSPLGVEEPAEKPGCEIDPSTVDNALVLVPGLTFDAAGYRLGYGGGFYDTFLAQFSGTSVGLCRTMQQCETLTARDTHDLPVDIVVTDKGAIYV